MFSEHAMMNVAARATARKAGYRTCLLPLSSLRFWRQAVPRHQFTPVEVRFWKKVAKAGPDDCWLWTGSRNQKGYGWIGSGGANGSNLRAHRLSWEIAHGSSVPVGRVVMHSCDNPSCVNPAHLSLGTQSANLLDMVAKGRRHKNNAAGEAHGCAVLTTEQVLYIRSSDKSSRELARELGVGKSTILRARTGKNWSHVT